jgi:hypothetical protein
MEQRGPVFIPDRTPENLGGDPFRVSPVARRIAEIVTSAQPPFTISLSGSWGVGKTTLVEEVCRRIPDTRIVVIDLWTEDLPQLRRKLAVELGAAIAESRDQKSQSQAREATADALDRATRASVTDDLDPKLEFGAFRKLLPGAEASPWRTLGLIYGVLGFVAATLVALTIRWELAGVMASVLTAMSVFLVVGSGQVISVRTSRQSLAPATEALALGEQLRRLIRRTSPAVESVLLVVDNLDRLGGHDAMTVLADIRAFVDDKDSRCIFLIPIDRDAFARSVRELVGTQRSARDYLEKFFNLDIVLTRPAGLDLRSWTRDLLAEAFPGHDPEDRTTAAELIAAASAGSPRAAKRIVNGVSARHWLIDSAARSGYSLSQLAVLEALISQFPYAAAMTARDARALTVARALLDDATDAENRTNAINGLVWHPKADGDVNGDYDPAQTMALRDFLLLADSVPLSVEDIATVLSLREDRSMQGVPNATAVKAAIRAGQPDELATAMAAFTPEHRALALRRGSELANDDATKEFRASAIAAVNALAPYVEEPDVRDSLRRTAAETLLATMPVLLRSLPSATVELVFRAARQNLRLDTLAVRAASELASDVNAEPRSGLILILTASAERLPDQSLADARKALAQLTDDDLTPLFTGGPKPQLVAGDVANAMIGRLAAWTPTTPDIAIALAAERVVACVDAGVIDPANLDPIAVALPTQLHIVSGPSVSGLDIIVKVLEHAKPSTNIDSLTQALASWTGDSERGLRLAASLPFSESANPYIAAPGATFVQSQPLDAVVRILAASRSALRRAKTDVAGSLARRWVAGEGRQFLDLVVPDADAEAWEAIRANLAAAPIAQFPAFAVEGATAMVSAQAPVSTLHSIRDVLVVRCSEMMAPQLAQTAPALSTLAVAGCDVTPVIEALLVRIGNAAAPEIADWTAMAEQISSATPESEANIVRAITQRSRALGAIDLGRVPWLIDHGANRAEVRDAVVGEVLSGRRTSAELAAALDSIRGKMLNVWPVRSAIVVRVQRVGAGGDPRPLLEQAKLWNKVPQSERAKDYDPALDTILAFGGLDDVVADLRA